MVYTADDGRNAEGYPDPTAERGMRRADMPRDDYKTRKAMSAMRYADGRPIERGDVVHMPGHPDMRLFRVIGYDLGRGLVLLQPPTGGVVKADPNAVGRW